MAYLPTSKTNKKELVKHTTAWPLMWVYIALITYASLYPFTQWRNLGITPWAFMVARLPYYWSKFDVAINIVGYIPLGFLATLAALRTNRSRLALFVGFVAAFLLSAFLEGLQTYIPKRIPSNVDWLLNTLGGLLGELFALLANKYGFWSLWENFKIRWVRSQSRNALALLLLWPWALLFPTAVPFGLGQFFQRLLAQIQTWAQDSTFSDWLPSYTTKLTPITPLSQLICIVLGTTAPILLLLSIINTKRQRIIASYLLIFIGILCLSLSNALTYGPDHAWTWLTTEVQIALVLTFILVTIIQFLSPKVCILLLILALVCQLSLLNQALATPFFEIVLTEWEQGRFIRFHGIAQWLGWLWPYATLLYACRQLMNKS